MGPTTVHDKLSTFLKVWSQIDRSSTGQSRASAPDTLPPSLQRSTLSRRGGTHSLLVTSNPHPLSSVLGGLYKSGTCDK